MEDGRICFDGILGKAKKRIQKHFYDVDTRNPSSLLRPNGPSGPAAATGFTLFLRFVSCTLRIGSHAVDRHLCIISPLRFYYLVDRICTVWLRSALAGFNMGQGGHSRCDGGGQTEEKACMPSHHSRRLPNGDVEEEA